MLWRPFLTYPQTKSRMIRRRMISRHGIRVKHMNLVVALEEEFNIHFEDAEIPSLVNFKIIVATIEAYAE